MKTLTPIKKSYHLGKISAAVAAVIAATFMQFLFPVAIAEQTDHSAAVSLEADFVEINEQTQEATFKGNVTLRQGSLEIHATEIVVKRDENGFQQGKATGSPAHFRQKREGGV